MKRFSSDLIQIEQPRRNMKMQGDIERKESWHVIIEEDVVQIYLLFFQNYVQLYLSKMTATDTE